MTEPQNVIIELLSLQGQMLFTETLSHFKGNYAKGIDVSSLAKGIYMLRIHSVRGTIVKKVTVQ